MNIFLLLLLFTHFTIVCTTLYLHRDQTHKSIELHPFISHIMRFWLWMSTGMNTKEWVAVHRKHHSSADKEGDPHSPLIYGLKKVFFKGAFLYRDAIKNSEMIERLGRGTPDDWIERKLYTAHPILGLILMLIIDLVLCGWLGFLVWGIQMIWIPLWAAGFINGIGHYIGYVNGKVDDTSKNIIPLGIWIGGEELHNNHHLSPKSYKFSRKWFEFDIGYMYIRILSFLGLAKLTGNAS